MGHTMLLRPRSSTRKCYFYTQMNLFNLKYPHLIEFSKIIPIILCPRGHENTAKSIYKSKLIFKFLGGKEYRHLPIIVYIHKDLSSKPSKTFLYSDYRTE